MKILLVNIDSRIPNLALEKCRLFHSLDTVDWVEGAFSGTSLFFNPEDYAKIFVSVIFPDNKSAAETWSIFPQSIIGGTGWDIQSKLPPEIESMRPKINWGFTTRGCIRKCPFCFVPQKEGGIRVEGDIYDIWDGKSKSVVLMDNNILALPQHFEKIVLQLIKENLKVDFNQGLDHRLVTREIAAQIMCLRHSSEIRFALDSEMLIPSAGRALSLLRDAGLRDWKTRWYVYCGPEDNFKSVYRRMKFLRDNRQLCYVMRDKSVYHTRANQVLSFWGNTPGVFKMGDILEACENSKRLKKYTNYVSEELANGK